MKKKYSFQKSNQRLKDFFFKKILSGLKKVLPVAFLFAAIEVKPQPWTFNTCGGTGQNGPSQLQANTAYGSTNLSGSVSVTGGIQSFTVPTSGMYNITAVGAQGGYNGGHGAFISGDFSLTVGDVIKILVGQQGVQGINYAPSGSGGGGGGSFVTDASNNPLVVAGGGGGNADGYGTANGGSGSTSGAVTSGMDASTTQNGAPYPTGSNGGTGGNGGTCGFGAGSGAGINGDGLLCSTASPQLGTAALSFTNGGTGGAGSSYNCSTCTGFGGFGGGGGGYDSGSGNRGGGGGGYSGGGGGEANNSNGDQAGGGGGSYNGGTNPLNSISTTGGDGAVYINLIQACSGAPASNGLSVPPPFCPGVGGTMSFTNIGVYLGVTGLTFQWYSSTAQAGPYTAISGATNTSYYTGTSLTSSSTPWFMATISCSNSPASTTSLAAVQVTVNSFMNCYCSSMASNTSDEEIYNVMMNGNVTNPAYSFANGCNTPAPGPGSIWSQYSNFTSLGTFANVFLGGSINTFSVAEDECDGPTYYDNGMAIYIDFNQNGSFSDPGEDVYVENATYYGPRNVNGSFVVPPGATPGLTGMRVIVAEGYGPSWNPLDPCLNYGYGETEDYLVNLIMPPACSGAPVSSNIIGAATPSVCPGTNLTLGLSAITSYSNLGITFQWYESTSGTAGSYNAVSGATSPFYGIAPSSDTYYMAEITCNNGPVASVSTAPQSVFMYTPVVSQVPYLETFEGLLADNTLPNCQWSTTSPLGAGGNISTHTSPGSNFYEDNHTSGGSMYATMNYGSYDSFYSNGIQMLAGVTYSAAMWYITDGYGMFNILSLGVNSSQSSGGQTIINQVGNMTNTSYSALSGTFTVPADGIYYMSVNYDDSYYYSSSISWDDLSVTIPCSENPAVFNLLGPSEVCSGTSYTLAIDTAGLPLSNLFGASSYTWNTGAQTASIVAAITAPAIYTALGTNSLGCIGTHTIAVGVNPIPVISIIAVPDPICAGQPVHIIAIGNANTYTWSTPSNNNTVSIVVSPSISTTYTVTGTSGDGCKNSASQLIVVSQAPDINALSSEGTNTICAGDGFNLQATGNSIDSYTWTSGSNVLMLGQNINVVAPNETTTYTVFATSAEGCIGSTMVTQSIYVCTGIETTTATQGMNVYPNPNNGAFTIELNNGVEKNINLLDITGRIVLSKATSQDKTEINISELANGIYYLKVQSNGASQIVKIVKQ